MQRTILKRNVCVALLFAASLMFPITGLSADAYNQGRPPTAPAHWKADDSAIRKILKEQETAWNKHDMQAFTKDFRDDAEGINVAGMHWKGKAALLKHLSDFHATFLKDVQEYLEDVQVRSISDDCAIAVNIWKVDGFSGPTGIEIPASRHLSTVVFSRAKDGWKIVHFHNTTVDERAIKAASASKEK